MNDELTLVRERLADEAHALAQPRLWGDTISALAGTAWRSATALGSDARGSLLNAAGTSLGLRMGPAQLDSGAIGAAQRVVRRGGPAYIKLGQFIASADGLLPQEWVNAFSWCVDDAPRISSRRVMSVVEHEIGLDAFAEFDPVPIAAGSIAQVHPAVLADGTRVVVKVRRPGLSRRLRADIGTLAIAAAAAEWFSDDVAAANLPGFVELFAELALEESDLRLEAENLTDSARIFAECGFDFVAVPRPIEGLVSKRVLVMTRVDGVRYDRAHVEDGQQMLALAVGGVMQAAALGHGLFHGDLHAGNVLVRDDHTFALVDFGICGRFTVPERASMLSYLLGFAQGDAALQAQALHDFGAIPVVTDELVDELGGELALVNARARGAITFERLGDGVRRQLAILARHGFRMPKALVLFFKNLLYLSSLAASIAPDADLFSVIGAAALQ